MDTDGADDQTGAGYEPSNTTAGPEDDPVDDGNNILTEIKKTVEAPAKEDTSGDKSSNDNGGMCVCCCSLIVECFPYCEW